MNGTQLYGSNPFRDLPHDVVFIIANHLNAKDYVGFRTTDHFLYNLLANDPPKFLTMCQNRSQNSQSQNKTLDALIRRAVQSNPTIHPHDYHSILRYLWNLDKLFLTDPIISDIAPLSRLTNLEILGLQHTRVSDISVLSELTNLKWLDIENTPVSSLSALSNLNNLELMILTKTHVQDLTPIRDLTSLNELLIGETLVSDISVLLNLTNLEILYVSYRKLSDLSIITELKARNVEVNDWE
mmetsp:Transcript_6098/g.10830  ORF Transcript_6098/g.10830 Transcript_6098/m.10830 type:complete len:241 (-) Transcript_6098:486-1208(-)